MSGGRTLTEVETVRHTHRYRLVKCISRFHLSGFTTLQSQVPFVSIGRRGRPCLCFSSQMLVHCQRASHLEQCRCSTHAAYPSHRSPNGPLQATCSPVQGRTPPYPIAAPKLSPLAEQSQREHFRFGQSGLWSRMAGFHKPLRLAKIIDHDVAVPLRIYPHLSW